MFLTIPARRRSIFEYVRNSDLHLVNHEFEHATKEIPEPESRNYVLLIVFFFIKFDTKLFFFAESRACIVHTVQSRCDSHCTHKSHDPYLLISTSVQR